MKTKILIIVLSSIAIFATGCQKNNLMDVASSTGTERRLDTVKEEVKEAGSSVNDYAYSQKDEYLSKMKMEIKKLKQALANLERQARRTNVRAKAGAAKNFQTIKNNVRKLDKQIDIMQSITEAKWDEVKSKFDQSIDEAKDAIEKSRIWLSIKITRIDY